jgi:hypothetical protein
MPGISEIERNKSDTFPFSILINVGIFLATTIPEGGSYGSEYLTSLAGAIYAQLAQRGPIWPVVAAVVATATVAGELRWAARRQIRRKQAIIISRLGYAASFISLMILIGTLVSKLFFELPVFDWIPGIILSVSLGWLYFCLSYYR